MAFSFVINSFLFEFYKQPQKNLYPQGWHIFSTFSYFALFEPALIPYTLSLIQGLCFLLKRGHENVYKCPCPWESVSFKY